MARAFCHVVCMEVPTAYMHTYADILRMHCAEQKYFDRAPTLFPDAGMALYRHHEAAGFDRRRAAGRRISCALFSDDADFASER